MFDHIGWSGDALTVTFPAHKGDQENNDGAPKHCYANLQNPSICPILALAVFVFTMPLRDGNQNRLLFSSVDRAENRFSKWLRAICGNFAADLLTMGLVLVDIGSHSFRKGIATFLSGMPGGPSPISIYLRAGWSLGPVQARYILGGGGGDQLCGRAATGTSLNDAAFADLPPHFDLSKGAVLTTAEWEDILPGYSTFYPQSFRSVLPFLLASLIFHRKWLEDTFPANSALFNKRVWTSGVMDRVREKVHTGRMCNEETGLSATGIPPHVVLANKMALMEDKLQNMEDKITEAINDLPPKVRDAIVDNMAINGVVPITPSHPNSNYTQTAMQSTTVGTEQKHRSSPQCTIQCK